MHECLHFYFFELCKKILPNITKKDFNSPSMLWYLSEIVVDPILNRREFQSIFKHQFKCYDFFYDINIDDKCIVNAISEIFNDNDVGSAIKLGLDYIEEHKEELI